MNTTLPVLYGISSKGVVKYWKISAELCVEGAEIITEYGQLGGKIQTSRKIVRKGKNIGRANETTPLRQACLEAESQWKKQHDKNYTEEMPQVGAESAAPKLLPMLAQKYNERKSYIVWPAFVQPKLNGVRCLVQRKGNKIFFWSRKAKQYKNFNLYMEQEFLSYMEDGEILDGEMYNHAKLTFQELISLIKDEKTPDVERLKKYVKFHCYDRVENKAFFDRYMRWRWTVPSGVNYLRLVETHKVQSEQELMDYHAQFIGDGYEGTIVRSGGAEPYRLQYRDNQLQKYKDFIDAEFEIVGCKEGTGKDEGCAIFRCVTKQGKEFDVRCKGTLEYRQQLWKNRDKYNGEPLTVRYQTLSDDGIPIFPVGIAVRDYE